MTGALDVIAKWQKWRNADHEDTAVLTRHEIITLLEEPRRLAARVAELEAALGTVKVLVAARAYIGVQVGNSCASARINDEDREIFFKWKDKCEAALAAKPIGEA